MLAQGLTAQHLHLPLERGNKLGLFQSFIFHLFPFFSAHSQAFNAIKQTYAINSIAPGMTRGPRWRSRCIMDLSENATLEKELNKQNS